MITFKQKKFTNTRIYQIKGNKLFITNRTLFNTDESIIELSNISENITNHSYNGFIYIILFFILAIVLALIIFKNGIDFSSNLFQAGFALLWIILLATFLGSYFFTTKKIVKIYLFNSTYLWLYKNKPGQDEVDQFIDCLYEHKNFQIKKLFINSENSDSYEEYREKLMYLLNKKLIDKNEMIQLLEKYHSEKENELEKDNFNDGFLTN